MAPLPSLAPSLWGAASPFTAALNSMRPQPAEEQQQPAPSSIQQAVFAAMNGKGKQVVPAAPAEGGAIKMYSPEYYMTCALGGVVSCGATHTAVTPLVSGWCLISSPAAAAAVGEHLRSWLYTIGVSWQRQPCRRCCSTGSRTLIPLNWQLLAQQVGPQRVSTEGV